MIIGVVGKPNVGKSTFFKAATLADAEIANYPFTTIGKNEAVGFASIDCVDKELNVECNPRLGYCIKKKRFVPVEMIDVAGLVPGAHEGKGRGNQFLDDLRQADVLIHVVDVSGSTNENGEEVEKGSYDPANDIRFLEEELDMWYFNILKKGWIRFARAVKQEKREIYKAIGNQFSGLKASDEIVKDAIIDLKLSDEFWNWSEEELKKLARDIRKITKPMLVAANKIDIDGENFEKLKKEFPDLMIIACSAEAELALKEAAKKKFIDYVPGGGDFEVIGEVSEQQKKGLDFIKEKVIDKFGSTGVQKVINKAVFELLGYIHVYPVPNANLKDSDGGVLPDCFLMPLGSTALDLAYKLHTDFGDNFVRAVDVKTKRVVGKDYELKDGDVIEVICGK